MQKTTAQSQQESQKQERDLGCFENHCTKKRTCAHLNVACPMHSGKSDEF